MPRKTSFNQNLFDAFLRNRFDVFVERCFRTLNAGQEFSRNWHHRAIAYELDRIRLGHNKRLIVNMPPRSLKSLTASAAFPAFVLGHEPNRRLFAISYGDDLANKNASDFRAIVESGWYRRIFPRMRISRNLEDRVETTERGFRRSTTVMGSLTGHGGDIFILDDPQKAIDAQSATKRKRVTEWFSNTLLSRLDDKRTGAIIVVMQRLHADDLCEYLWERSGDWAVLSLPAIAEHDEVIQVGDHEFYHRKTGDVLHPEREPIEILEAHRHMIGSYDFSAQYQQSPVLPGGGMIEPGWLRYYDADKLSDIAYGNRIIHSWDTAAKEGIQNSRSVCTIWLVDDRDYYLLHLEHGRFNYPALRRAALELAERYRPSEVLVEDASTGPALAEDLQRSLQISITPVSAKLSKIERLYIQQTKFEAGHVHFPRAASFLPELENELLAFPYGKTDDIVDSITQALAHDFGGYDATLSWV